MRIIGFAFLVPGIILSILGVGFFSTMRGMGATIAGGVCGGLGAVFTLIAVIALLRDRVDRRRADLILQTGLETRGTVTFVDRNFSVRINGRPIYSIIEYTFKDRMGRDYTRTMRNAPSDIVIRRKIEVGSELPVKYLANDPEQSVIVLNPV